jgi:hypothetical protein
MKNNRSIPAKSHLTPDQYLDLMADAEAANKSASSLLRDCWLACRNGTTRRRQSDRPSLVPFQAKFAPGRSTRGFARMNS